MNSKYKTVIKTMVLASTLVVFLGEASAIIYKCVDSEGVVIYNDKPCPKTATEHQLKNTKDIEGGYNPPGYVSKDDTKTSGVIVGKDKLKKAGRIDNKKKKSHKSAGLEQRNEAGKTHISRDGQGQIKSDADNVDSTNTHSTTLDDVKSEDGHNDREKFISKPVIQEPGEFVKGKVQIYN